MSKLKKWLKEIQKFCADHFKLILSVTGIMVVGGVLGLIFDPIFAVVFPLWLAFVAYIFKKQHENNKYERVHG